MTLTVPERLRVCADAIQRAYEAPSNRVRAQLLIESRQEIYAILSDLRNHLTSLTMTLPRPSPAADRPRWFDLVPDQALLRYWREVPEITVPLARTLAKLGIRDLQQLAEHSEASLLRTPYIGFDSLRRIKHALSDAGLRLQGTGTFPLEPVRAQNAAGGAT